MHANGDILQCVIQDDQGVLDYNGVKICGFDKILMQEIMDKYDQCDQINKVTIMIIVTPKVLQFALEIALTDRFLKPNGSSMKSIIANDTK